MPSSDGAAVVRVPVSMERGSGPEGGNSAYVLPDSGVVVDPGPPGDAAWRDLRDGLADAGADIVTDGISDVLVTHWHVDHAGLAPRLAAAADATLWLHERDAPLVSDYALERERRLERDAETLARWGVPEDRYRPLIEADTASPIPETVPVSSLADGDRVGPLETVHAPGHTAGHAAFAVDDRVLAGDALLRTVTPNVGGGDTRQTNPLSAYRRTLARLDDGFSEALPGHGTAFAVAPRVRELRAHHGERAERTLEVLGSLEDELGATDSARNADGSGVTPWAVATTLFGEMAGYHVKFGAGEAFAHLVDLAGQGVVERVESNPLRFRLDHDEGSALGAAGDDSPLAGLWDG